MQLSVFERRRVFPARRPVFEQALYPERVRGRWTTMAVSKRARAAFTCWLTCTGKFTASLLGFYTRAGKTGKFTRERPAHQNRPALAHFEHPGAAWHTKTGPRSPILSTRGQRRAPDLAGAGAEALPRRNVSARPVPDARIYRKIFTVTVITK